MTYFLIILAYLMGSIPSGLLIVKAFKGIDIREHGSGNIGATNVRRVCGYKYAVPSGVCDLLKAFIPTVITDMLFRFNIVEGNRAFVLCAVALAAILGHNYSIFLKFKGGKGVATTMAAFFYILPIPMIIALAFFIFLRYITKIISIRSMTLGIVLFISTCILGYSKEYIIATFIACALIFWRHKANIKRIIDGTEK